MACRFGELECTRVSSDKDRSDAEGVWRRIYGEKLGLTAPPGPTSNHGDQHLILLVRTREGTPIATGLWQSPGFAPGEAEEPYEADQSYRIPTLLDARRLTRPRLAELRRLAVLQNHPFVFRLLIATAIEYSERAGITHWLGLVEAGTRYPDLAMLYGVLEAHGLVARDLPLAPLEPSALWCAAKSGEPGASNALCREPLRGLPVPRKLRSFSRSFDARVISTPSTHVRFERTIVPVLAEIATFKDLWTLEQKKGAA